jgi:uncharacterized protein (DUF1800 family)
MSRLQAAIATTRFGMGPRPGEITAASRDPRQWLKKQVRSDAAKMRAGNLPSTLQVIASQGFAYGIEGVARPAGGMPAADLSEMMRAEIAARLRHAITTPNPFAERWARFWSNHFTAATRNVPMRGLAGPYEREAIRPHVFGSFATLLHKASLHQGMLVYLDAHRSIGPSTEAAAARDIGLNENLAREILELHTMGVGSGYSQDDIIEFARALTGWTLAGTRLARLGAGARRPAQQRRASLGQAPGATIFVEGLHEPGARSVLGKRYAMAGREQAGAILDALAAHPATARHIATKLATHFVADTPPAAAVAKLEAVFNDTRGDLAALAHAVIDLDAAWSNDTTARKFKSPDELMISVGRAASAQAPGAIAGFYAMLGHLPFSAPSPAGWPDDTASWAGSDAIKKRLEWANNIARRMARGASPSAFLDQALGELAGEQTRRAVSSAESAEQGFTIAIMSPEFQRR